MSEHKAKIAWERTGDDFSVRAYTRDHTWTFEGGEVVRASAAPAYLGSETHVDPEEALVASLSSCHMMTFLYIASMKKYVIDSYSDSAVGHVEKNDAGKLAVTRIVLRPDIQFSGEKIPTAEEIAAMHDGAHAECFIANSITASVVVEPA